MKFNAINKKLILIFLFALFMLLTMTFFLTVYADEYTFTAESIYSEDIKVGDEVIIPEGRFGDVKANVYIYYPDGNSAYNLDKLYITSHGRYVITYLAVIKGKTYVKEQYIDVENDLFGFKGTNGNSSASYGFNEFTDRTGILAKIAQGDSFEFNEVIDLNKTDYFNPAVALTFAPNVIGFHDAQHIILTFTDAYNKDNKVQIRLRINTGSKGTSYWCNCQARANGQTWAGYDYSTTQRVTRIGSPYSTQINTYACNEATEIVGETVYNVTDIFKKQYLKFWMDTSTNELFVSYVRLKDNRVLKTPIIDLDDMSYQTAPFDGFTNGEVFLSVSADLYTASTANVLFTEIGQSDLSSDTVEDRGTVIDVDFGEYDQNDLPKGSVGYSYPVFDAVASDVYSGGYIKCEKRVFYGYTRISGLYDNANGSYVCELNIIDGKFNTPYLGYYAICYRVKLFNGKICERVVGITVSDEVKSLDEVVFGDAATTGKVGNVIDLAEVVSYGGGNGDVAVKLTVKDGNGKDCVVYGNDSRGYWFVPEKAGNYTVKYTAEDLVSNTKTASYNVSVSATTSASINKKIDLPDYFIADANYVLPEVYAKNYDTGKEILASVKVYDASGEKDYVSGNTIKFSGSEVTVQYYSGENSVSITRPIINVKNNNLLVLENYFISSDTITVTNESAGIMFTATGDGETRFIKSLSDRDLTFETSLSDFGVKFNIFSVILTDSVDKNISVKLTLKASGSGANILFNGKTAVENYLNSFTDSLRFVVAYNDGVMTVDSKYMIKADKTLNGDEFNGFPSGNVFITLCMDEVVSPATAYLTKVKNQRFNSGIKSDGVKPIIYINGDYGCLVRELNEEVEVLSAITDDVLGSYTTLNVSVEYEDTTVISSVDGKQLSDVSASVNYKFKPQKTGVYYINYTAIDWNNKKENITCKIVVLDTVAPTLTVGSFVKEAKVGKIKLPEIIAQDNSGEEITVFVSVIKPDSYVVYAENNTFVADKAGEYTVVVSAFDKTGNTSVEVYKIQVKAK